MGFLRTRSAFEAVRAASERSQPLALVGIALILWMAVAGVVVFYLHGERDEALRRATRSAEALVRLLDAHTARTYQAVDITLSGVARTLHLAPSLRRNDPEFQRALVEALQSLQPFARAIFVVDANGRLLHDSNFPRTPEVSLHDREYFLAHLRSPALKSAIWPPLRSRARPEWFLAVTRRIGDDTKFRGVVVASLEPRYFQALFSRLGLQSADVIALYHRDGTQIARYPHREDEVGKSFAHTAIFAQHLPRAETASYITDTGVFSFERLVSYRALAEMPLVVAMSQSTESILAPWRDTALAAAIGLAGLLLLLVALLVQFVRQQRARELVRKRQAQSEKLEALGQLTGGVSHDFANLLNVIAASLRIIQAGPIDERRIREAASVGERAVLRGSQLVDQLRSFSRRQPLHVQSADLNVLISAGLELLRQALGRSLQLETDLAEGVARCLLDETELEVSLVNLLVNAKDAGARRIVLRTYDCTDKVKPQGWRGQRAGDYVCLSVADDGSGMSEQVRRRIFEPYYTTKGEAGTGLGLAQVYGFLRQVGGDVHVESQPGKGTTVYLLFPRAPVAHAQPTA
jgi:signal transduction histidine kinase